jgi:hypothetical protein
MDNTNQYGNGAVSLNLTHNWLKCICQTNQTSGHTYFSRGTVQADIFHSFSQLLQETLITAFLLNIIIIISYNPHISNECT